MSNEESKDPDSEKHKTVCSFCQKSRQQVSRMIGGPSGFICENCVEICLKILTKDLAEHPNSEMDMIGMPITPKIVHEMLNQYIIGQERAKKILSVALYIQNLRLQYNAQPSRDLEISKSNILIIGPTGSGKTYFAKIIAMAMDLVLVIFDMANVTQPGYVGQDPDMMLNMLLIAAGNDQKKAERGIVFLDEIDKISRKGENPSITRDVSGEGVQQAILKIVEGSTVYISKNNGRKHPHDENIPFDTNNVLFIAGGSFEGLDKIIRARLKKKNNIGFQLPDDKKHAGALGAAAPSGEEESILHHVQSEDLVKFGLMPEIVGRFSVVVTLDSLDESSLFKILKDTKNSLINQYQALFNLKQVQLFFTDEALVHIAQRAIKVKTGARGLRVIVEKVLLEYFYTLPDLAQKEEIHITVADIERILDEKPVNDNAMSEVDIAVAA